MLLKEKVVYYISPCVTFLSFISRLRLIISFYTATHVDMPRGEMTTEINAFASKG